MTALVASVETFAKNSTTATAEIDGQLVALDIQAGVCFGLNEVATHIWKLLDEHRAVADLCAALNGIYEVDPTTCEDQTRALLYELVDAGLIKRV